MELSAMAIKDLRLELQKKYGSDFNLTDEELNKIGLYLLTSLMEGLKLKKYNIIDELHQENYKNTQVVL